MPDLLGFAIAFGLSLAGFATMALGQDRHWAGVTGLALSARWPAARLLGVGLCAQAAALAWLVHGQGGSFGSLLWGLCMSAAALAVALLLAWRPAALRRLARCLTCPTSTSG